MSDSTENSGPLRIEPRADDRIRIFRLDRPKGNVIDRSMTMALQEAFAGVKEQRGLRAVVLTHSGPNFSFGASVAEHRPEEVANMLRDFHALFRAIAAAEIPVLAAVRGHCLGGGLELAAFCHRVFASPGSKLGQPEIVLGVFAPVASALLPERCGRPAAEDLCLTGRTIHGDEAHRIRLVDELAEDPEAAALAYAEKHLLPHSSSSLRHALRAVRGRFLEGFFEHLASLERGYLVDLMATRDAVEGIEAFLEKRRPQWSEA